MTAGLPGAHWGSEGQHSQSLPRGERQSRVRSTMALAVITPGWLGAHCVST